MNMSSYSCCSTEQSSDDLITLASTLRIIGEPNRLRIVCALQDTAEHCVCELMEHIPGMSQSLLSHHLADLKAASLVESEKRGLRVYYKLTKTGVLITRTVLSLVEKEVSV